MLQMMNHRNEFYYFPLRHDSMLLFSLINAFGMFNITKIHFALTYRVQLNKKVGNCKDP